MPILRSINSVLVSCLILLLIPQPSSGFPSTMDGDADQMTLTGRWADGICSSVVTRGDTVIYNHGGIIENLILILCVFVSVLIHELGHAAAARYFGGYDVRVILYGMGGMMLNNHALSRKEKLIELFCGPAAGFALSTISFIILQLGSGVNAINFLFRINLFWSLLNLLSPPIHLT